MKKLLMVAIYIFIGRQAMALYTPANDILRAPAAAKISAPAQKMNICSIEAGDIGKLKYRAASYEEAFSKVTDECFKRRNALYVKNRKQQPDQDRQIQFAESCVNTVNCI